MGSTDKFISKLEQNGFTVTNGTAIHFDPIGQYCRGELPNALYVNNGASYAAAMVPDSPRGEAATPLVPEFRIAPDEAVVLIGWTPPEEKYFSYQISATGCMRKKQSQDSCSTVWGIPSKSTPSIQLVRIRSIVQAVTSDWRI